MGVFLSFWLCVYDKYIPIPILLVLAFAEYNWTGLEDQGQRCI